MPAACTRRHPPRLSRYTLELAQRESASVAASKEDLDLEVVSSVNAARQREAQLSELGVSLDRARSQTEEAREQLRTEQARADGLAADLAASKREVSKREEDDDEDIGPAATFAICCKACLS